MLEANPIVPIYVDMCFCSHCNENCGVFDPKTYGDEHRKTNPYHNLFIKRNVMVGWGGGEPTLIRESVNMLK